MVIYNVLYRIFIQYLKSLKEILNINDVKKYLLLKPSKARFQISN